jgi:hypothetical protein
MLRERINVAHLESDHFAAQLVERLAWAVSDAHAAEQAYPAERDAAAEQAGQAGPPTLVPYAEPCADSSKAEVRMDLEHTAGPERDRHRR